MVEVHEISSDSDSGSDAEAGDVEGALADDSVVQNASNKSSNSVGKNSTAKAATTTRPAPLPNSLVDYLLQPGQKKTNKNAKKSASHKKGKKAKKTQNSVDGEATAQEKRPATQRLESFDDPDYITTDEDEDNRRGGAKLDPLLKKISYPCRKVSDPERDKVARCIGSVRCHSSWAWPRSQQRVFKHAAGCPWVPVELRAAVEERLALKASKSAPVIPTVRSRDDPEADDSSPDDTTAVSPSSDACAAKRTRTDASQPSLEQAARQHGRKLLKQRADLELTHVLVDCGIPSRVVDHPRFLRFCSTLNSAYVAPSSTTVRDKLVPNEAARIHVELTKQLTQIRNLTLSFDGGKTRRPRGVYTVTVTTPARQGFLYDLQDTSKVSHTAEYLLEVMEVVRLAYTTIWDTRSLTP